MTVESAMTGAAFVLVTGLVDAATSAGAARSEEGAIGLSMP